MIMMMINFFFLPTAKSNYLGMGDVDYIIYYMSIEFFRNITRTWD